MTVNLNGLVYETEVLNELKKVNNVDFHYVDSTAGFNPYGTDIQFLLKGDRVNLEVKASPDDQMGGSSITYCYSNNYFGWANNCTVSNLIQTDLINEYSTRQTHLDSLIDYLKEQKPFQLHEQIRGFSLNVTKEAWEKAKEQKLLVPLNLKIEKDISFMYDHYANKNTYYIQIGNCGLFYLKDNPYDLPIKQLTGKYIQEFRVVRSGSHFVQKYDERVSSVGIRVQGRLKGVGKSDYTLDNIDSINTILNYKNVLNNIEC